MLGWPTLLLLVAVAAAALATFFAPASAATAAHALAAHAGDVGVPPLPVRAGLLPGSQSETPSGSATPSASPTVSDSASASASASGTPSGTPSPSGTGTASPSGTPSGTPSNSPSPSATPVFGTRECARAAADLLNRTNAGVLQRCLHAGGAQNRLPMGADIAHGALWAACPAGAAEATYWEYASALAPADICYVVFSRSRANTEAAAAGWASAPANLWFVAPEADAALRVLACPRSPACRRSAGSPRSSPPWPRCPRPRAASGGSSGPTLPG